MSCVYVVLGEAGDYSDREVWVSGVFTDEGAAMAHMFVRMAVRREWDEWNRRKFDGYFRLGGATDLAPEVMAEAVRRAGPEPMAESAERCSLVVVPLDVWGCFPVSEDVFACRADE